MLGSSQELTWRNDKQSGQDYGRVVIDIPESLKGQIKGEYAYTLKIQIAE